ncbi:MAG: T9SS type A sorting domain-containing protein [Bacteroidota bacterium]
MAQPTAKERSVMVSATVQSSPPQIELSWPAESGEQYTIYKRQSASEAWGPAYTTLPGDATSYTDTEVTVGTRYEYAIFRQEYSTVVDTVCLPPNTPIRFAIRDFNNKGVCCNFGYGFYDLQLCGETVASGGDFRSEEISEFTICDSEQACEPLIITIQPDMFPNSTYWQISDQRDGSLLAGSGPVGQFLAPRPAYGFISAGIDLPTVQERGSILLVIDEGYLDPLQSELEVLEEDLRHDGWRVQQISANREDEVTSVKAKIRTVYEATSDLRAIYLIGHVPVPYSGDMYPDTHSENHWGAWSADCYYGEMTSDWTDSIANNELAFFERNKNVPGDGKFDQSAIPSEMELAVGRVDFFNMLAFAKSEIELTRAYLQKAHRWKMGEISVRRRGLVDDNFRQQFAAPAASGWRNFAPMFGTDNIDELDYFSTMRNNSYLWSYGCGSGSHMSSEGIGSTFDFANDSLLTVFTMLFGSQFGDWDNDNNFLKAPLASGLTLSNVWAGNPPWQFHDMATGDYLGGSVLRTQNSDNGGYRSGPQLVHVALMGDPSLRMHPVAVPTELSWFSNGQTVKLEWTASADNAVDSYHVYRSNSPEGPWSRLTMEPVEALSFSDAAPINGVNHYQVRAVKREVTGSGSYYNQSLAASTSLDFVVSTATLQDINFRLFPNPVQQQLRLDCRQPVEGPLQISIYNASGQLVHQSNRSSLSSGQSELLHTAQWQDGIYVVKISGKHIRYFTKVIKLSN